MSDPSGLRVSEPSADSDFHSPGYWIKQNREKQANKADQAAVTKAYVEARQRQSTIDPPVTDAEGSSSGIDVPEPTNWWDSLREWARSEDGQNVSLGLGTFALSAPLVAGIVSSRLGPQVGAIAGVAVSSAGLASTAIDCIAEATSPACVIGIVGSLGGGLGSSLLKAPKHLSLAAEVAGKVLTVAGINADALGGIIAWGDWWQRSNFGAGDE